MPIRLQIYWFALFLLPATANAQSPATQAAQPQAFPGQTIPLSAQVPAPQAAQAPVPQAPAPQVARLLIPRSAQVPVPPAARLPWSHGRLQPTPDGHYLQYADGTPFFWLGDTGWELFHRLTLEEIKTYLDDRAAKGFTVIQAVVLAEFDGLRRPNRYGDVPLHNLDPAQPNQRYFTLVDSTLKLAQTRGLFIGLLPTWGDKVTQMWGEGPFIFDSVNAYKYGRWLGNRYKDCPNIIWILGGDRPALTKDNDWRPVWRRMAAGIIDATGHRCLITYHPSGGPNSTSQWIHNEPWLDIDMFQSGHGSGHDTPCWEYVTRDRALKPAKPTLDAEPNYEDHPVNPWPRWNPETGRFNDYDVRKQLYRSVFAGACGVTYGHHAVWQFMSAREEAINYPDRGWLNALQRPGATQAGYLRRLIESRPSGQRIPDSTLLVQGQDSKAGRPERPESAGDHAEAFRGSDYAMIYLPIGKPVVIDPQPLHVANVTAWWFNPRDNKAEKMGSFPATRPLSLTPPSQGPGQDWVLVLDATTRHYPPPSQSATPSPRNSPPAPAPPHRIQQGKPRGRSMTRRPGIPVIEDAGHQRKQVAETESNPRSLIEEIEGSEKDHKRNNRENDPQKDSRRPLAMPGPIPVRKIDHGEQEKQEGDQGEPGTIKNGISPET